MNCFFGENLKILRLSKGLSQSQLSKELGKGQKTIGNWETGYSEPSINELIRISHFFDIDLDSLVKQRLFQSCTLLEFTHKNEKADTKCGMAIQFDIHDMRQLWTEELKDCTEADDDINVRDAYIALLENKLYDEITNRITQRILQNTISKLMAIQKAVIELADGITEENTAILFG